LFFSLSQFVVFDNTCSISTGAIYSILAAACFFVVGCIGCCTPKPEPMLKRGGEKGEKDDDYDHEDHAEPKAEEEEAKGDEEGAEGKASAPKYDATAY
jgi:hypothetical protein